MLGPGTGPSHPEQHGGKILSRLKGYQREHRPNAGHPDGDTPVDMRSVGRVAQQWYAPNGSKQAGERETNGEDVFELGGLAFTEAQPGLQAINRHVKGGRHRERAHEREQK